MGIGSSEVGDPLRGGDINRCRRLPTGALLEPELGMSVAGAKDVEKHTSSLMLLKFREFCEVEAVKLPRYSGASTILTDCTDSPIIPDMLVPAKLSKLFKGKFSCSVIVQLGRKVRSLATEAATIGSEVGANAFILDEGGGDVGDDNFSMAFEETVTLLLRSELWMIDSVEDD